MGTIITDPVSPGYPQQVRVPDPLEFVRAGGGVGTPVTIDGQDGNGGVVYTGKDPLARIRQRPGASLSVTVAGKDVDVVYGPADTAGDIEAAVNADAGAFALLGSLGTGTGAGLAGDSGGWVPLAPGSRGSVRPAFKALVERTAYVKGKVQGLVSGILTLAGAVIDGTGDQSVPPDAGKVQVGSGGTVRVVLDGITGFVEAAAAYLSGDLIVDNTGSNRAELNSFGLRLRGANAQPAYNAAGQTNRLTAMNFPKAWVLVATAGGTPNIEAGYNIASVTLGTNYIDVTFKEPMSSGKYTVSVGGDDADDPNRHLYWSCTLGNRQAAKVRIALKNNPLTATALTIDVTVMGPQPV